MNKALFEIILVILATFSLNLAQAQTFDYIIKPRIVSAPDGDTIKIWTKQTPVSVRLNLETRLSTPMI